MKTILIWDDMLEGHHLEYLHHIYEASISVEAKFIFVVPDSFKIIKNLMVWSNADNVAFDYMDQQEIDKLRGGYFKSAYKRSICLRKYALKYSADVIFLTTLCLPFPLLPFILPRQTKVSGVIYQIYFYKWKQLSLPEKIKYVLETWSMAKSPCSKHPLILNDASAARFFNKVYNTNKYISIVDPVVVSKDTPTCDRNKYSIPENDVVFLHFGAMDKRKGTLDLINAIYNLSDADIKNKTFVLAGKVGSAIKEDFYYLYNKAKLKGANIIVYDYFCEYSIIDELCYLCDYIAIPYRSVELSSGVVGHSSKYGTRLIGPSEGVIGKLIRQCPGSIAISKLNPINLSEVIANCSKYTKRINTDYLTKNSIEQFQHQVIESLMN